MEMEEVSNVTEGNCVNEIAEAKELSNVTNRNCGNKVSLCWLL